MEYGAAEIRRITADLLMAMGLSLWKGGDPITSGADNGG